MTPDRIYTDYLGDLLAALQKGNRFVRDMDFEEFTEDEKTVFAVIRALEIAGEAAKQIPPRVRTKYPGVPWREMSGMRDKLIHHYFGVDLQVVWKTVKEETPVLIPLLQRVLDEENA